MKSEANIKAEILLWLSEQSNIIAWNNPTGLAKSMDGKYHIRFGLVGSPDILGVIGPPGRFLGIETKTLRGKQRESQKRFQKAFEAQGGLYMVARSVDDVREGLDEA